MTQTGTMLGLEGGDRQPRELHDLVHHIEDLLREPTPESAQRIGDDWVAAVRKNLAALHERLMAQFQEEVRAGLPANLVAAVPHIADRVESLRREHDRILLELRALLDAADNVLVQGPLAYADLREGTLKALGRLVRHGDLDTESPLLVYS